MSDAPPDIEAAALLAFGSDLNPKATGMGRVAKSSIRYASIDHERREVVIDVRAIVHAILALGRIDPPNAAGWFATFVDSHTATIPERFEPRHSEGEIAKAVMGGLSVTLSRTMRGALVPRALWIAQLTVRRNVYDLRHLLMALLHQADLDWLLLGINFSHAGLVNARRAVVTPIEKAHERGERTTVWRQLINTPPEQIGLEDGVAETSPKGRVSAPPPHEAVPIHTDDPAIVDLLGREGFATVMGDRIIEARARAARDAEHGGDDDDNRAFIIHMHGPWGSGKSTVLNFIRHRLEKEEPPWVVVEFNAWRSQRLRPPWWSIILQIQKAAIRARQGFLSRHWFALRWHWMRARADLVPMVSGVALLLLAILFVVLAFSSPGGDPAAQMEVAQKAAVSATNAKQVAMAANAAANATQASILGVTKDVFASIAAVATGIGAVIAFGRSLLFGSGTAARAFEDLRDDPYGPMMTLFCGLIRTIDRPIIVFIDDLDRCESAYVCELLESIQTMLRAAPITYLVAADRKWICSSFERRYADFAALGTDAGRPLGYQFLDKLFQVSANLPVIPATLREAFWGGLLEPPGSDGSRRAAITTIDPEQARAQAAAIVSGQTSYEGMQAAAKSAKDPVLQQAIRAEGARQISKTDGARQTEHRLKAMGHLIESNPRAMKRLANAVGMNLARLQIEGRDEASFEAIARWTIMELRWPLLADWISEDLSRIERRSPPSDTEGADRLMADLMADAGVLAVIGGAREKGRLSRAALAHLIA